MIIDAYNLNSKVKYIGFLFFDNPVLIIRDTELIKIIAIKSFDNFLDPRIFVDELRDPLFGKKLFSLKNDRWRETRTMLSPAFAYRF